MPTRRIPIKVPTSAVFETKAANRGHGITLIILKRELKKGSTDPKDSIIMKFVIP